ncbi:hypothetical protein D3C79_1053390 [compost metagenome]
MQGVGKHDRTLLVTHIWRAGDVEADLHVVFAVLLKALVAHHLVGATAGDDVALAEQGTPGSLTGASIADGEAAREGARVVEVFVLVDSGFF